MKSALSAFGAGLLFAAGLGMGGMTDPANVLGFLDFTGAWNPRLLFVMVGALAVHAPLRLVFARKRAAPLLGGTFAAPPKTPVDARLVVGAGIFGVGWGLSGYCPGPAVVSVASALPGPLVFMLAMALGLWLFDRLSAGAKMSKPVAPARVDG